MKNHPEIRFSAQFKSPAPSVFPVGKKILFKIVLLALLVANLPAHAQENYALDEIKFAGNKTFSSRVLLNQMVMHSKSIWQKVFFWKEPYRFSENELQRDLKRLINFYNREGFVKAKIDTFLFSTNEQKESVKVLIKISEGNPVIIGRVDFRISAQASNIRTGTRAILESIQAKFLLKEGQRYRDEDLIADREAILSAYANRGYPYIRAMPELLVNQKRNRVEVTIKIEPGPLCLFGEAKIIGNEKTPASIIKKQVAFRKGQIFSQKALRQSQRQIYQLGVFQFVTIRVLLEEAKSNRLPVQIQVKEAPQTTLKFGMGYGREDQVRGFLDLRRLGFFGGARRLNLFAKHSGLEPMNINFSLSQPAFLHPKTILTLNPFFRTEKEPGFRVDRVGANLTLQRHFARYTDSYLNYNLEQVSLNVPEQTRAVALDSAKISIYNKSSVTFGMATDNSGPIFQPNHGMFRALTFTLSGIAFPSDFNYFRMILEMRRYHAVTEWVTLAYRLKIGMMQSLHGSQFTPIEERFYAGGSNSVRGWARSRLGPKSPEGRPIGGNSLLEGSVELRFPIWNLFSGVTFLDFGYVWPETLKYDLADLHYAVGVGLRVRTPIGPLRLDVGKPVTRPSEPVQLHISIGHAF